MLGERDLKTEIKNKNNRRGEGEGEVVVDSVMSVCVSQGLTPASNSIF